MTPFLQFAIALAIVIAAAKAFGYLSFRLGQPSVLGELIAGILLGPTVINLLERSYFTNAHLGEAVHQLAELGVLFLMFLAGLELHISDLAKSGKVAAFSGVSGVLVPILLGAAASYLYLGSIQEAIFIGLILAATSVSISAQTLMELKVLRSRVGISMLGAAVFDDILVVLLLSIFTALTATVGSTGFFNVIWVIIRMGLFVTLAGWLGYWLLPRLSARITHLSVSQGLAAFSVLVILIYGWAAEELGGMAAITGAFLAGLILGRSPVRDRIEGVINVIAFSFFVPIFFVNIGLSADIRELFGSNFWFFIVITILAVAGKIIGAGLGGILGGLSRRESLQLGVGMISRGEVGLIVASVGIANGFINQAIFSVVVGIVVVTTLITPPLLRRAFEPTDLPVKPPGTKPNSPAPDSLAPEGEK